MCIVLVCVREAVRRHTEMNLLCGYVKTCENIMNACESMYTFEQTYEYIHVLACVNSYVCKSMCMHPDHSWKICKSVNCVRQK